MLLKMMQPGGKEGNNNSHPHGHNRPNHHQMHMMNKNQMMMMNMQMKGNPKNLTPQA